MPGKNVGDYFYSDAAKDYYNAQKPELDAIKNGKPYSAWDYLSDLPAVAAAKFNLYRDTNLDNVRDDKTPNYNASELMDQMREVAKKQAAHQHLSPQDLGTLQNWQEMPSGWIYMKASEK